MSRIFIQEPFPAWAWPSAWDWLLPFKDRVLDDFSPQTREAWVQNQMDRAEQGLDRTWGVWRGDDDASELGGAFSFQAWNPINGSAHCFFKRAFWGHETTETAIRLLLDQLFGEGLAKVTTVVFEDNHAIRRLVRRVGFNELRDPIRDFTQRNGKLINGVLIELRKDDYALASCDGSAHWSIRSNGRPEKQIEENDERTSNDVQARSHSGTTGGGVVPLHEGEHAHNGPGSGPGTTPQRSDADGGLGLHRPARPHQEDAPRPRNPHSGGKCAGNGVAVESLALG